MELIASTTLTGLQGSLDKTNVALDTLWVIAAAILVMFMQAGFAFLEMGFSRQKNAGAVVAPLIAHWLFSGGWLAASLGSQDFAGSTVVHLTGATGGLAVLLLLGPRRGKYGADGKPNVIPGHSMPFVGLATFILWFGWFGFNPGSTLSALSSVPGHPSNIRFADIVLVTNIAAACGVLVVLATIWLKPRKPDIGVACIGAIPALDAITAP